VGAADVRRVWQEIQEAVKQRKKRTAALLVSATVRAVEHDTLVLSIGTAPLARLLSEQSNTEVIAEALHAVLGVRWRVRCEHGDGPGPRGQEQRQAPRAGGAAQQPRAPQPPAGGSVPTGGVAGQAPGAPAGQAPGERTAAGAAGGRPAGTGGPPSRNGGPRASDPLLSSGVASAPRAGGRATGRDEGVPLPPEPPDDDVPPDDLAPEDEEAMLAEMDAGPAEPLPVGPNPEEAAIALLTSQLGARAIDRR
jgi:DNA polymerase III subunit gamma/tau